MLQKMSFFLNMEIRLVFFFSIYIFNFSNFAGSKNMPTKLLIFLYSCITLIILAFALDLSSLSSVRKFSQEVLKTAGDKIDILINNAGIMMIEETITVDGNEKQMQVNHIGHFLLTQLLMPNLIRGSARIINVSSLAHTWSKSI